ncbi:hypothetical protein [uncultured Muribaculum sp.]|uniref:hypothetical protein n=1 Tax=uncultured Muribaculum sp. TaxID=1918613 RepID=UPI00258786A7|nr:hypothetical protein [uncultured Muribaculum sp.]
MPIYVTSAYGTSSRFTPTAHSIPQRGLRAKALGLVGVIHMYGLRPIYICTTNSEDTQNARATQTGRDGSHLGSGNGANQPGRQPRTNYNRIRAGYIFNP